MLDFSHVLNTPGYDVQQFMGVSSATASTGAGGQQWQTWRKPRGAKFVYMLAVGGGASGGTGTNTATTSGGGGGGGSGAQSTLLIPAMFVPDVLYILCGMGGRPAATIATATAGVGGTVTYISAEPFETVVPLTNSVFLLAGGGGGGTAASVTVAGGAGAAGGAGTIATAPLAGKGQYFFLAGQAGTTGGNGTAGTAGGTLTIPATGLMVMGGTGGGGKTATVFGTGGPITSAPGGVSALNTDIWPLSIPADTAATGATPAGVGRHGIILKNSIMNFGGAGGGASDETSGGIAGAGGNAAPGSGGGGAGGSSVTAGVTTLARPGDGGDGFVFMISF